MSEKVLLSTKHIFCNQCSSKGAQMRRTNQTTCAKSHRVIFNISKHLKSTKTRRSYLN